MIEWLYLKFQYSTFLCQSIPTLTLAPHLRHTGRRRTRSPPVRWVGNSVEMGNIKHLGAGGKQDMVRLCFQSKNKTKASRKKYTLLYYLRFLSTLPLKLFNRQIFTSKKNECKGCCCKHHQPACPPTNPGAWNVLDSFAEKPEWTAFSRSSSRPGDSFTKEIHVSWIPLISGKIWQQKTRVESQWIFTWIYTGDSKVTWKGSARGLHPAIPLSLRVLLHLHVYQNDVWSSNTTTLFMFIRGLQNELQNTKKQFWSCLVSLPTLGYQYT